MISTLKRRALFVESQVRNGSIPLDLFQKRGKLNSYEQNYGDVPVLLYVQPTFRVVVVGRCLSQY